MHVAVQIVITAAGVLVALGVIWRYGTGFLQWAGRHINRELTEKVEEINVRANSPILQLLQDHTRRLDVVESELTVNSGKSLKDAVIRLEKKVDRLLGAS